jgi:hypothetical protein
LSFFDWLYIELPHTRGGLAIMATRQMPRGSFLRMPGFFKNAWHFKDIFRECEAFLKISIRFEYIFREIEAFFDDCERFSKIVRLLNTFLVESFEAF